MTQDHPHPRIHHLQDTHALHLGHTPLLISFPHVGTAIPPALHGHFTPRALLAEDTDWFLDRLYGFAATLGATLLVPRYSRYVVDLNRASDNAPMYPGQNNTELCPTRHFTGEALYRPGLAPGPEAIAQRVAQYWQPYHDTLHSQLVRLKALHGYAVLFDAHSIKSTLPWLFDGELPHLNLGSVNGSSCAPSLRNAVAAVFAAQSAFSHVVDGRFKGGHITRHFGQPQHCVHALQLEMCWRAYMDEAPPYRWHGARAQSITPLLQNMVQALLAWRPQTNGPAGHG